MKRNIIAVICVMLAAIFVFASCTKKAKYYVDNRGESHLAYTDNNGETVTNRDGGVLVIKTDRYGDAVTDKYGRQVTEAINEGYRINGKTITTSAYNLVIPDGWEIHSDIDNYVQLRLKNDEKENETKVDISYSTNDYEESVKAIEEIQKTFAGSAKEVLINTKEEITLNNSEKSPATLITFLGSTIKDDKTIYSGFKYYIFKNSSYTFLVFCGLNSKEDIDNIDFEAVINAIEFK